MDALVAAYTVPEARMDMPPLAGDPGYATDGDPLVGLVPTDWPAHAYNAILRSLLHVVDAGGVPRDRRDFTVLLRSLQRLARGRPYVPPFGTTTWVVPPDIYLARVKMVGPGGSGGSSTSPSFPGGGGGGGAYCEAIVDLIPGTVMTIRRGVGIAGGQGDSCLFGPLKDTTYLVAGSGQPGGNGSSVIQGLGGQGGIPSGGQVSFRGSGGASGIVIGGGNIEGGSSGGPCGPFSAPVQRTVGSTSIPFDANAGYAPGGGSAGCTRASAPGGDGFVQIDF